MRIVHVTHFKARAFATQAARSERRQSSFMRQLRQRIVLIHKLRQLRRAEELFHCRDHRSNVDQNLRRDDVGVLDRHAFADDALHSRQADPVLILKKFADRADTSIAEVINVVGKSDPVNQIEHVTYRRKNVGKADRTIFMNVEFGRTKHRHYPIVGREHFDFYRI